MEDAEGNRYEGNFRQNKKDGSFVEKDKNGNVTRRGVYSNGVVTQ